MSEMLERVAKRIYAEMHRRDMLDFCPGRNFDDEADHIQNIFRDLAYGAIEAMREPTYDMRHMGFWRQ